ncbi:MAG TPA: NAD(P)/FAD-dependent oxidoreductase [Thermoanaerobaculia bacterium]|nr:NAD(P)/FAD-dependent oxidoreductase [Thermoanaerobaculia bacterium]
MHTERIAIIGAGFSGLGAAAALRRHGIAYDQFDANAELGGTWYHGAYQGVHTITSKRVTQFADFEMPADYPDFPSREQVRAYLEAFADRFRLREDLHLATRVEWIEPAGGERWRLRFASGDERIYRGVVISSGQLWDRRYPDLPGRFDGETLHSGEYRDAEQLRDKRVLVVGGGNSAADIAIDAAAVAAVAHVSMRRGTWYLPKRLLGVPTDELLQLGLPRPIERGLIRALLRLTIGRYESYGLERPREPLFSTRPTINDQLLYWIQHGKIEARRGIRRLDGKRVEFADGRAGEYDLICYATGFRASIPFLRPGIVAFENDVPDAVAGLYARHHANLYVFGIGKLMPIPRYGVGPPLTAGAELLAVSIREQRHLRRPLGEILARLGMSPRPDRLIDPRTAMRLIPILTRCLPWLRRIEGLLFGNAAPEPTPGPVEIA